MASLDTVLIVDDDPAMCEMLAAQLADAGLDTAVAGGVEEALAALEKRHFSAVVTDLYMTPLTGFDLLEKSKDGPPVILMSSFASKKIQDEGISRGALAVLRKPFRPDELLELLQSLD